MFLIFVYTLLVWLWAVLLNGTKGFFLLKDRHWTFFVHCEFCYVPSLFDFLICFWLWCIVCVVSVVLSRCACVVHVWPVVCDECLLCVSRLCNCSGYVIVQSSIILLLVWTVIMSVWYTKGTNFSVLTWHACFTKTKPCLFKKKATPNLCYKHGLYRHLIEACMIIKFMFYLLRHLTNSILKYIMLGSNWNNHTSCLKLLHVLCSF